MMLMAMLKALQVETQYLLVHLLNVYSTWVVIVDFS